MSRVSTSTITACKGVVSLAIRKRPALAEVIGANVGTDAEGDGDADGAVVEQGTEAFKEKSNSMLQQSQCCLNSMLQV